MNQKILVLILIHFTINLLGQDDTWKYFGQTPPSDIPEIFAPGIVSTNGLEHSSPTFSSDLKLLLWSSIEYPTSENIKKIYFCKYVDGEWTNAQVAPFSGEYSDDSPFLLNNKLFFSSQRDIKQLSDSLKELHWTLKPNWEIWFSELLNDEWSEPVMFLNPFDNHQKIMQLNFSSSGNIYFLSHLEDVEQQCGIFFAKNNNTNYSKPQPLPDYINSKLQDWTPFIAPDESYIIFSSTRNTSRNDYGDLYISFKINDNEWTEAIYMGDKINTSEQERFPSVSPDGKYLFFTRSTETGQDVFWVSAKIIMDLQKQIIEK